MTGQNFPYNGEKISNTAEPAPRCLRYNFGFGHPGTGQTPAEPGSVGAPQTKRFTRGTPALAVACRCDGSCQFADLIVRRTLAVPIEPSDLPPNSNRKRFGRVSCKRCPVGVDLSPSGARVAP